MEVFSEAEGVSFWFLMHQLLCTEIKARRSGAWMLYLGWMGVNFLQSFAADSPAFCLPSRTSAFCLGKLELIVQKEFPKAGRGQGQSAQSSCVAHRKAFKIRYGVTDEFW